MEVIATCQTVTNVQVKYFHLKQKEGENSKVPVWD